MRRSVAVLLGLVFVAASLAVVAPATPAAALPTGWASSTDYATEEFGDPWDFSNPQDWDFQAMAESPGATGSVGGGVLSFDQTRAAGGVLLGSAHYGEQSLQWGRSTWLHPINTDAYRTLTFRLYEPSTPSVGGVELLTCSGTVGSCATHLNFFPTAGWNNYSLTLPPGLNVYSVLIVPGPDQRSGFQLDWVRITRDGGQTTPFPAGSSEPVPVVLEPNRAGGQDYAAAVRGKAWTFDDGADVIGIHDLDSVSYSGGAFNGCSTSNDPAIVLAMGAPLQASIYNRVSTRVWYEGGYGLADVPGGGMVARLKWHIAGTDGYQTSQDIVVYPGWNDIELPMLTFPAGAVTEPDLGPGAGWVGAIDEIRFDFHEDPGRRCVAMDSFAIRAADEARPSFTFRYRDDARGTGAPAPGTTAEIFLDTSVGTFGGTRIASGLGVGNGENTFTWPGGAVPKGVYFPWIRLTDGTGHQSSAYAGGPIVYAGVPPLAARSKTPVTSGAPGGVAAVLANLTMTESTGGGYVTAEDRCDRFATTPNTSNGNFNAGQNIANLGVVRLGPNSGFCLFNESPVHLIADVQGYFSTGGNLRFTRSGPTRVLNTRTGPRVAPGSVTRVASGAPGGAAAVLVNLTMTDGAEGGFITADRCDALHAGVQPSQSNGNFIPQRNIANLAVVPVASDGSFCIFSEASVHLLADVQGFFSGGGNLGLTLIDSSRPLDTRTGAKPGDNSITEVNPGVGAAEAVLVNITMTNAPGGGYITADRCDRLEAKLQDKSNGNFTGGQNIANLSVVPLDGNGRFCIYAEHAVDLIVDVQGTFTGAGPLAFTSIAPDRRLDTRKAG